MQHRLVLAITGGGSAAIDRLFAQPGASRLMVEATVPYHPRALAQFLGAPVEQACSQTTARQLAVAAWQRATTYSLDESSGPLQAVGLGCTAALASDRQRQGSDRAFVVVHSLEQTLCLAIDWGISTFQAGDRSFRQRQEEWTSQLILSALVETGIPLPHLSQETLPPPVTEIEATSGGRLRQQRCSPSTDLTRLTSGQLVALQGRSSEDAINTFAQGPIDRQLLIFPGSFNPLHEGHRQMAQLAAERFSKPVYFELSITNADKPTLDYLTIDERLAQLRSSGHPWFLTRAARFDEKARLFPAATFIVGADTIVRIGHPRYYAEGTRGRDAALQALARHDCRFLVFGRQTGGQFQPADQLELPPALRELCIPDSSFRNDISSTALRKQRGELPSPPTCP